MKLTTLCPSWWREKKRLRWHQWSTTAPHTSCGSNTATFIVSIYLCIVISLSLADYWSKSLIWIYQGRVLQPCMAWNQLQTVYLLHLCWSNKERNTISQFSYCFRAPKLESFFLTFLQPVVAMTKKNANAALVYSFLYKIVQVSVFYQDSPLTSTC